MFCKFIRLINGDNILATTASDCTDIVTQDKIQLRNPVQINRVRFPKNGYVVEAQVFTHWIAGGITDIVELPTKNIVVAVDAKENIVKQYQEFVENATDETIDEEFGFEDGVEDYTDAEFFDEEYDEDEDDSDSGTDRVYH